MIIIDADARTSLSFEVLSLILSANIKKTLHSFCSIQIWVFYIINDIILR